MLTLSTTDRLSPGTCPRTPGGFVISEHADTLVPWKMTAMAERTIIQWDKDDPTPSACSRWIFLALGMLSAIAVVSTAASPRNQDLALATIPKDDPPPTR